MIPGNNLKDNLYMHPVYGTAFLESEREIEKLRHALEVARAWVPVRPLTTSAWDDVNCINTALGYASPPKPTENERTKPSREFEIGMAALTVAPAPWWRGWLKAIKNMEAIFGPESEESFEKDSLVISLRDELRRREGRQ